MEQDERSIRISKLEQLTSAGIAIYPETYDKKDFIKDCLEKKEGEKIQTTGRIMLIRIMGKIIFAHIKDQSGKMQIALQQDIIGKEKFIVFQKLIDMGDFLGVKGEIFITKTGEKTILVKEYTFLGKCLRPLPEKYHGIQDKEIKYRQRYLDLLMDSSTMDRFLFRSRFIKTLRDFYEKENFIEVETNVLGNSASGALAKPFTTHHNALDLDVFLRIALETPQKELIVGGFERTFEIGKVFRNEGMDPSHLQEFTMVEHYAAYWNYENNMRFTEKMFAYLLTKLLGTLTISIPDRDGNMMEVDFTPPYQVISFKDLLIKDCGIDIEVIQTTEALRKIIKEKKIDVEDINSLEYGNLIDALYKKVSRPAMKGPIFLIGHPIELSPLARKNDDNPKIVDRFQLVVNGWELVNAYSELVDPLDQKQRFEEQSKAKAKGDKDAHGKDDEYVKSMEYGMPPISGLGMGIDRLIALLTKQSSLRDVILFPLMKPEQIHNSSENEKEEKTRVQTNTSSPIQAGISYDHARKIFDEHIKDPITRSHSRESEVVMRALAKRLGENEEVWGIVGLLHDIDWEYTQNDVKNHCVKAIDILKKGGVSNDLIEVIISHAYGTECGDYQDKVRTTSFQHALAAGETVTGLIYAYGLMRPDKKLANAEVKSIKKKFKDKSFAAKVNRDVIQECEQCGLSLDEFLEISLNAMKEIAPEIGL